MIKLECKGQIPPANGDIIVEELGHKIVKKGEVIEVDDTKGEILLEKYPRNFKVYVAPVVAEPEQKNIEDYSDKQMKEYNRKGGKKGDKPTDTDQIEFV